MASQSQTFKRSLPALALAAAALTGCAAGQDDATGDLAGDDQALQAPAPTTPPTTSTAPATPPVLRDPAGAYFAEVTANGTGCPAGTWNTSLAPDGKTFTTTFSAYEASVTPSTAISFKDCMLAIKLHSPQGLSYSVTNFFYSGYAYLEQGVTGRQFASYYFQGNPAQSAQLRTDLAGPYDDTFLFSDTVGVADQVWSPCGVDRDLNVVTRLRLLNGTPRRNGYMNVAAVDASVKLVVKLAWRTCSASSL